MAELHRGRTEKMAEKKAARKSEKIRYEFVDGAELPSDDRATINEQRTTTMNPTCVMNPTAVTRTPKRSSHRCCAIKTVVGRETPAADIILKRLPPDKSGQVG